MAIKLVDELKAMGNFPIAHAEGINLVKTDGTEDNLQNLFDNGELGGGDNSTTLTQQEYEALSEEQKLNGLYYTYDTKRIYKNGVQYGVSEPITLTMEEYKALKEAGAIDEQQEYLIETNTEGVLLGAEDIGYNNAVSGIQATTVQGAIDKIAETSGDVYSTEEKVIGTWIDGKPIYRKTIEFSTSTLSAGENYVSHGLQNIELLMVNKDWSFLVNVSAQGRSTMWQFGNSVNSDVSTISGYSCNIVWTDASTISIYIGSNLNPKKAIITFEYTKTTDA